MATITIDGISYQVTEGDNLLQACLGLGLDLPYFCWHPAMGSVGACRQCALVQYQDQNDERGRLIVGCMTPVADGQILSIRTEKAVNFRAGVIESLMTNHPHDCPVCEEGGECHLQDMTVMSGHHRRRYQGLKRTFPNQDLGPFIRHEMNRCITCYRCVRYYRDYAGGGDLHAMASRNNTYFGRFEDGSLESEFSGNLVEVCPTGVFTDKTLSDHYSRKWDLQCAPSVCVHCSLGCNTTPGERYGVLKRIQNRYNPEVNGYFLCDRGRFGYDFVNHSQRPRQPLLRLPLQGAETNSSETKSISSQEATDHLQQLFQDEDIHWIGIGSPRATLESNLALQRLVGNQRFFSGLNRQAEAINQAMLKLLREGSGLAVSMSQVEQSDAVLILGEDITQTAPRLALSVRQAINAAGQEKASQLGILPWQTQAVANISQNSHYPLHLSHSAATKLDALAQSSYFASPREQARLGCAIAHAICDEAPPVSGLTNQQSTLAEQIAADLIQAKHPLIIAGASHQCLELIEALGQILRALQKRRMALKQDEPEPWVSLVFDECNSLGLALLNHRGQENCLDDAFAIVERPHGRHDIGVIILENDLFNRAPEDKVENFFKQLAHCVVIDYLPSRTLEAAELVLPASSFAETQGVIINNEGRGQQLFPVYPAPDDIMMSWQWLYDASSKASAEDTDSVLADFVSPASALEACIKADPMLAALAQFQDLELLRFSGTKMARMSHRASGRTAMSAQINVHEPQQPKDSDSALAYTMEGVPATALTQNQPGSQLISSSWYPGWNSNQSMHKFQQEITAVLEEALTGPTLKAATLEEATRNKIRTFVLLPLASHSIDNSTDKGMAKGENQLEGDEQTLWVQPPKKSRGNSEQLLLVPQRTIFGSDELSALAPAVAKRIASPRIYLHPQDAKAHHIQPGDLVQIDGDGQLFELAVEINDQQAKRLALIADFHPALRGRRGSSWINIHSLGPNPVIATDRDPKRDKEMDKGRKNGGILKHEGDHDD